MSHSHPHLHSSQSSMLPHIPQGIHMNYTSDNSISSNKASGGNTSSNSTDQSKPEKISIQELSKHNKENDMWLQIYNKVYDLTDFASDHPGGVKVLLDQAGKDATQAFNVVHNKDILQMLYDSYPNAEVGQIDPDSIREEMSKEELIEEVKKLELKERKPPLEQCVNIYDFESIAKQGMTVEGWAYYCSGSDDEITLRENHCAFQRIWLRPRVLVNVKRISMGTSMFGTSVSFPLYVTGTALGRLAHPSGEIGIIEGSHREDIIYMLPTLSSCSLDEMLDARKPDEKKYKNWMQLYVNADRQRTLKAIKKAEAAGCQALCITVDAPMLGRRERDMRHKFTSQESSAQKGDKIQRNQGVTRAISSFIDPSLSWSDLQWFRDNTSMKIVLKGVQTGEDAILAAKHNVDGIICSNHGGRQIDGARSGIEILPEVMQALKSVNAEKRIEVYVDGGVRRGTDIFKAIAMGAKGVGIGRPTLWGLAAYGADGVAKVLSLLRDELAMCMTLMGTPTIKDITANHVITTSLQQHIVAVPKDYLPSYTYHPMRPMGLAPPQSKL